MYRKRFSQNNKKYVLLVTNFSGRTDRQTPQGDIGFIASSPLSLPEVVWLSSGVGEIPGGQQPGGWPLLGSTWGHPFTHLGHPDPNLGMDMRARHREGGIRPGLTVKEQ